MLALRARLDRRSGKISRWAGDGAGLSLSPLARVGGPARVYIRGTHGFCAPEIGMCALRTAAFGFRCGEGVSLLALEEARGEAGAVPTSPCHDSKAVYLAALLLEHHTRPGFLFASPAVFGSGASLPGDVSTAPF